MAAWELFAAAAFAPVVVWILWRLQTVSVDVLRSRLALLTRNWDQRWIYAIVSWFGTFLHEVSHASVLLLSGQGIRGFKAGVEQGHVTPGRSRGGVGLLFFLVAALAPLFIPPLLVLLAIQFLLRGDLFDFHVATAGLPGAVDALRATLVDFPRRLVTAVGRLDLATWKGLLVLALVLLGSPASRPSHIKSRWHGPEGDVAVLRARIRHNPLPFLLFVAALYGAYFLFAQLAPSAYWIPLEAVWMVALTGITLALFGALWWSLAALDGRVKPLLSWAGPAAFVAVQVFARALDGAWTILQVNLASLAAWLAVALLFGLVARRRSR